jgi:hypothetical protein
MLNNISSYLAVEKDIVLLDNYEASQVHFPVGWKKGVNPLNLIGDFGTNHKPCLSFSAFKTQTGKPIDYILTLEEPAQPTDSCTKNVISQLSKNYDLIYSTPMKNGKLYKVKM